MHALNANPRLIRQATLAVLITILAGGSALAQTGAPSTGLTGQVETFASGSPNPRAVSMYNLGLSAYKQGSPESAIIFFKRACDIDPNLADAQYNLAVIYQAQKRYKEALPRFEEVLRIKPTDPDANFQMGLLLIELGRYPEARQHFTAIAPNNPRFQDAQRNIARLDGQPAMAQPPVIQQAQQPVQPYDVNPVQPTYPVQQTAPIADSGQPPVAPIQNPQPYIQPTDIGTLPQNFTPPAPYQGSAPDPVPVLANTSLKVIASGFSAPAGITFDKQDNMYVANFMSNTIERIGADGVKSLFSSGINLRGPIGLIMDDAGNLYVANYNGGTVARISPAGVSSIVATGFKKPYYLTLDREGNLYVSQQEDNSIVRITLPPRPTASRP